MIKVNIIQALPSDKIKMTTLSKIIRWVEKIGYSHYAIKFDNKICEAVFPKTRTVSVQKWEESYKVYRSFTVVLPCSKDEFLAWRKSTNGIGYAVLQLLGILFVYIGLTKTAIFVSGMTCNERVLNMFEILGKIKIDHTSSYGMKQTEEVITKWLDR